MSWPLFTEADIIELFHIESFPQTKVLSRAGTFNFQTSGLALRSRLSSTLIVLQFEPVNYTACFLPVFDDSNNISQLLWDKRAKISYSTKLDIEFWQQSTYLGVLNGVIYANFMVYVSEYLDTHPAYIPQSICNAPESSECFITSQTSETFVVDSLNLLAQLSVEMHAILPLRITDVKIICTSVPIITEVSTKSFSTYTGKLLIVAKANINRKVAASNSLNQSKKALSKPHMSNPYHQINPSTAPSSSSKSSKSFTVMPISEAGIDDVTLLPYPHMLENVSKSDVIEYFATLVSCLSQYELETYHSALRSCFSQSTSFIHIINKNSNGTLDDVYYQVFPRFPFVYYSHHVVDIPRANQISNNEQNLADSLIAIVVITFLVYGLFYSLWRSKLIDWVGTKAKQIRRTASSTISSLSMNSSNTYNVGDFGNKHSWEISNILDWSNKVVNSRNRQTSKVTTKEEFDSVIQSQHLFTTNKYLDPCSVQNLLHVESLLDEPTNNFASPQSAEEGYISEKSDLSRIQRRNGELVSHDNDLHNSEALLNRHFKLEEEILGFDMGNLTIVNWHELDYF